MGHSEQVQDDYNRRAIEYIEALGSVEQMATPDRELISEWRDSCSGPLLDAGCGPGHWTELLSQDGRDVLGVDLSEEFIGHARAAYPDVNFERGDFRRLPLQSHSLGGILAWYSLIHTEPSAVPQILEEFARVLRPGGSALLGFFGGTDGEEFDHAVSRAYFWSLEGMNNALKAAGFKVVESHQRTVPGSRPHAAVIARRPGFSTP